MAESVLFTIVRHLTAAVPGGGVITFTYPGDAGGEQFVYDEAELVIDGQFIPSSLYTLRIGDAAATVTLAASISAPANTTARLGLKRPQRLGVDAGSVMPNTRMKVITVTGNITLGADHKGAFLNVVSGSDVTITLPNDWNRTEQVVLHRGGAGAILVPPLGSVTGTEVLQCTSNPDGVSAAWAIRGGGSVAAGGDDSGAPGVALDITQPTIGGDFTFARAGDDWAPNASGVWTNYGNNVPMPAYENGVQVGFWNWPTRTNTSRRNINPTALTSVNLISGAGSVAEVVSLDATQATALAAAGLQNRCTGNVYKVTAGGSDVKINMSFGHGGDPDAALSAFFKTTDSSAGYMFPSTNEEFKAEIPVTGDKFEWITLENLHTSQLTGAPSWALCVRAGKTVWFILNQIENAMTCTPPIHTGSSAGTRAASTLSIQGLNTKSYFGDGQAATFLMEFTPRKFPIGVGFQPPNQRFLWVSNAANTMVMGLEHGFQREYLDMVSRVNNVVVLDNEGLKVGSFLNARRNVVSHSWANGRHAAWVENWKPRDQAGAIPTGMDRAYFFSGPTGDQGFSGIINRIEVYGSRLAAPAIAAKAPRTGRQMALLIGQSWMENWAGNQADRDPNPRRHFVETMRVLQPWTEWDLLQGAKGSTSFDRQSSGQAELSFWYDHEFVPGTKGVPFVDCIWAVENALAQGHRIPVILHTNHTTTRSPAVYSTLLDGVYRYIYSFLQDMIEQKQGFKPKILMIPHSRRDDPASANPTTYQLNRIFNADLKAAFAGIGFDLAPEIYGAGAQHSDGLHWSTQMYFDYNPLLANKIHQMLGYSTGKGVDGPKITNVSIASTTVTVTVAHDLDGADFSNADPNDFEGFSAFNGDASPITISSAARVSATEIEVELGSTPTGAAEFYYGYGEMRNVNPAKVPKDENGLALRYSGPWDIS